MDAAGVAATPFLRSLRYRPPKITEAEVGLPRIQWMPVTIGAPQRFRFIEPTAAANHLLLIRRRDRLFPIRGVSVGRRVGAKGVSAPLPNIAVHAIKSPAIRLLRTDRMTHPFRTRIEPGEFRQLFVLNVFPPREAPSRPRPTRILPFGFGGQ